ncbi:hypothetical protein [Streptomyces sp. HPF1205]|uniref:hypothetical protein n=1 Tax=Streptomyces sp. HPF1205 TaxID=2873262 RepID=UPI001CED5382|nr:hypothetical protein [Streptomyces sp. HPF1205]
MDIDELVIALGALPGAEVGRGPWSQEEPDEEQRKEIEDFLSLYPRLRQDAGYVDFLKRYSGAVIADEKRGQYVDIFGFGEVSSHILEIEGDVVDEEGYLVFAQCMYHDIRDGALLDSFEYDFAYNVKERQEPGVYCCRSTLGDRSQPFVRYADDFSSWLGELVAARGWFRAPVPE